jgi:hypothetical protein
MPSAAERRGLVVIRTYADEGLRLVGRDALKLLKPPSVRLLLGRRRLRVIVIKKVRLPLSKNGLSTVEWVCGACAVRPPSTQGEYRVQQVS